MAKIWDSISPFFQNAAEENDWTITENVPLDGRTVDRLGNKLLIGNGFIGYRGTLEEFDREQKTATIVSGLYDKVGDAWREPINLPNGLYAHYFCQGEPLNALTGQVITHMQSLDMCHGIHRRTTTFATKSGVHLTIRSERFASLAQLSLLCSRLIVSADQDCGFTLQTGIDGEVWDLNGPHLEQFDLSEEAGILSLAAVTHQKRVPVCVAEINVADETPTRTIREDKRILHETQFLLKAGQEYVIERYAAHVTGQQSAQPTQEAVELCSQAAQHGYASLLAAHCELWRKRWQDCDIRIQGDGAAQQALRFSMYHLLAIAPAHSQSVSIPARGLSGQVYKGGIFWDTEIFMLPFFDFSFPDLARNLLLYRSHTLAGAKHKAREFGFRGAFYAWESQDDGDDACTFFNVTDVFTNRPMRTYFRDKQVHISADVVYAFWQYYSLTGDASIWEQGGAEVIFECARFFVSYLYYRPDQQRYEVLDVTGPDEYHERVHNNAFTNWMVAHTLEVCLKVAELTRQQYPRVYSHVFGDESARRDLETISQMAAGIYRPETAAQEGVIPQFDGYFSLEDVSMQDLLARRLDPHEYLGGGNGLATTTQILKQADVVLGLYLFGNRFSHETKQANWDYYEPRCENGSSLSACSYSMIAAQLGRVEWAYDYFMKTATIDITGEGKQYVGPLYIGGTHPAANGGAWMAAIFGLCGFHCSEDTLHIEPHLPESWRQVEFPVKFKGQSLHLMITHENIRLTLDKPLTHLLKVEVSGAFHMVEDGLELNY